MVAPTSHSNSRAELARCANFCCHVARSPPFRADAVGQSPSLNGMTNGHELRNMHGEHDSPCIFRTAGHDNQKCDLWPCAFHDAPASEKPVRHHDFRYILYHPPQSNFSTDLQTDTDDSRTRRRCAHRVGAFESMRTPCRSPPNSKALENGSCERPLGGELVGSVQATSPCCCSS